MTGHLMARSYFHERHKMTRVWILQGKRKGHERQFICERLSQEGCIAERDKRIGPTVKVVNDPKSPLGKRVIVVPSEWEWTAITTDDRRNQIPYGQRSR
jgi:hypothetical protein